MIPAGEENHHEHQFHKHGCQDGQRRPGRQGHGTKGIPQPPSHRNRAPLQKPEYPEQEPHHQEVLPEIPRLDPGGHGTEEGHEQHGAADKDHRGAGQGKCRFKICAIAAVIEDHIDDLRNHGRGHQYHADGGSQDEIQGNPVNPAQGHPFFAGAAPCLAEEEAHHRNQQQHAHAEENRRSDAVAIEEVKLPLPLGEGILGIIRDDPRQQAEHLQRLLRRALHKNIVQGIIVGDIEPFQGAVFLPRRHGIVLPVEVGVFGKACGKVNVQPFHISRHHLARLLLQKDEAEAVVFQQDIPAVVVR